MVDPVVDPVVLTHAGAGAWGADLERGIRAAGRAAEAGLRCLRGGGAAVDAVTAAVSVLEDDPTTNAGTGGALTAAGTLELDAAVMDGVTRRSGAVAALRPFRHPILIARALLDEGWPALLVAEGAAAFAQARGFSPADPATMITAAQREALLTGHDRGNTVGAVAADASGHVAAATSTGGISGQAVGRVGDSPIVGAGTYADALAAVSCTGHGEAFARALAAFWVCERIGAGWDLPGALEAGLARVQTDFGGLGGMIVVDTEGQVAYRRTTRVMPVAIARTGGTVLTC